ncbi:hypothetical protein OF829_14730 [Sphingomonas sp. LB-2]|uniref:hypothetical protein n=1 Tax=Sphingomonas caeni TaxID=2984949 RepID=UPI002230A581|nr:hypothetical protein [Sphingomonas caeni]MCW3848494.1 hypothetical protein [Sphingomonas caeni]
MAETGDKAEPAIKSLGRRRRGYGGGSGRGARSKIRVGNVLHAPNFERWLNVAVGVVALVYVGLMGQWFHADTVMIGFRPTGVPRSEILYGWNRPQFVGNSGTPMVRVDKATPMDDYEFWQYPGEGGGTYRFHFATDGQSDEVSCFQAAGDPGACPDAFGVKLGEFESHIAWRLGSAPVRELNGPAAELRYPSVGLEFGLEQYSLRRITIHRQTSSIFSRIPLFLRFLVP